MAFFSTTMRHRPTIGFVIALILPLIFGLPANAQEPASQQQWAQAVNRTLTRYLMLPAGTAELQGDQTVRLRMTVAPDGTIRNVKIEQSSGHANVDQAALRMVKRAGKLPPFSRDMEKKDLAVTLPVHMKIMPPVQKAIAPPELRKDRYVDEKSGFTVEVATPFKLGEPRSERNYDRIIGVKSLLKTPPHVGKRSHLCEVGFTASAARDAKRSQAELNASNAIRIRTDAMVKIQNILQGRVEKTETFEQDGATGIEFIVAPGIGPNHASVRQYIAMVDRPAGRITVTCATYATSMPNALEAFRQIRDGARLEAKKQ